MNDLLPGYDAWLDSPYQRDMDERAEAEEECEEEEEEEDQEDLVEVGKEHLASVSG